MTGTEMNGIPDERGNRQRSQKWKSSVKAVVNWGYID